MICNSIVPPGRDQILNTNTGDKSPAFFLVVPPGHTGTATALNAEMPELQRRPAYMLLARTERRLRDKWNHRSEWHDWAELGSWMT
jgi:hypothetical protein